ncbi:MAG TPA: RNA polymerase sigma-70 factor [Chitinophagaceae bacterium]|nr:RNA polymerase sigma-70 factor [Chitinophagaceae bacterium]
MINKDKLFYLRDRICNYDDEKAFEQLFLLCFSPLTRFAFSFLHSREQGEEITSDVLLRVWNRRNKLDEIADFRLYLYVSIRNASLNQLKKRKKRQTFSLDETSLWLKADGSTPEDAFITKEALKKVQAAIHKLPPRCRLIYKLIKEDDLKYREAAGLLQLSVKTIEAQMGIAMKRLHEALYKVTREAQKANEE